MIFRRFFPLLMSVLLLLFAAVPAAAESADPDDAIISLGTMRVVNCESWVSLREACSSGSKRLAKVPLGALVTNCFLDREEMVWCEYDGQTGFILRQYLEPFWMKFAQELYQGPCPFPLTAELISAGGSRVVDWLRGTLRVVVWRDEDPESGTEALIACALRSGSSVPLWSRLLTLPDSGELPGLTGFMGGTAQEPRLLLYNCDLGLTMLNPENGQELWTLSAEQGRLGAGNAFAVAPDGTMYITGYYGPDPVAVSPDGAVLWRAHPGDSRLSWPYELSLSGSTLLVKYSSPDAEHYLLASYDLQGNLLRVRAVQSEN